MKVIVQKNIRASQKICVLKYQTQHVKTGRFYYKKMISYSITLILFSIFFSISSNAQNEIKKKLTSKSLDSLKIKFEDIVKRIEIKKQQPPKPIDLNNLKKDTINTNITLSQECGIIVTKTIEKYGWLSTSLAGISINNNLGLILNYSNDSIKNKYKSLIKTFVLKGESTPNNYAKLIDGLLVYNGKSQIYGTIVGPDPYSDEFKMRVYDVINPEFVNQRRKEIGLNKIEDYLSVYEIKWEIPQKKE